MKPTLVLLAAGMSTRYGRLKQLEPVGPEGEALLDFAVADAIRAGFTRVLLIIREELEGAFRTHIENRWPSDLDVVYHHQHIGDLPGIDRNVAQLVSERTKPWGTAHAVLTARPHLQGPFVLLNADDFYGAEAYRQALAFLGELGEGGPARGVSSSTPHSPSFALVTYTLGDTLSDHGGVSRGVCRVEEEGGERWLRGIREVLDIQEDRDALVGKTVSGDPVTLSGREPISTNFWTFTPEVFPILERRLDGFLSEVEANRDQAPEFLIPPVVNDAVAEGEARVRCIPTEGRFLGITHPQDRESVVKGLDVMTKEGRYPRPLWR